MFMYLKVLFNFHPLLLYFSCVSNVIKQRITIAELIENEWFKKGYKQPSFEEANISLDDVHAIFDESVVRFL